MSVSTWARSALQTLIAGAGLLLLPARAVAAPADAPRAIDLRWKAPDGCPSADEVRGEIARLLGASARRQPIVVEIAVARERGARLRLRLRIRAPAPGKRELRGDDCASMSRAAALIVAMSIDPDAVARSSGSQRTEGAGSQRTEGAGSQRTGSAAPDAGAPLPHPAPPADAPPPRPAPRAAARAPRPAPPGARRSSAPADRRIEGTLWLGAQLEQALVPAVGLGVAAGGGVRAGWFRADGAVGVVPSRSSRIDGQQAGADFRLWFLELDACARLLRRPVGVYACALGRQSWLLARGLAVDEAFTPTTPIAAAGLGAQISWPIAPPLGIEGALHALVPLSRPRFIVENLEGTVYRPPAAGVSARLGLSLTF